MEKKMQFEFDPQKMRERFEVFKKIDAQSYPFSFSEFWRRKVQIEAQGDSILSEKNAQATYNKLSVTLKGWRWHRPYSFAKFAENLQTALVNIRENYDTIKGHSLLELQAIANDHLRSIWDELGAVKDLRKNKGGYYLVMPTTKPMMFLWGQTLAFDVIVRGLMPRFGMSGLHDFRWTYETWKQVMTKFADILRAQPQLTDVIKEISLKEYRTDSMVPYGQFMDLYFWASDPKRKCA
jgi:hypothetical protein